jgi:hypothetical protein
MDLMKTARNKNDLEDSKNEEAEQDWDLWWTIENEPLAFVSIKEKESKKEKKRVW